MQEILRLMAYGLSAIRTADGTANVTADCENCSGTGQVPDSYLLPDGMMDIDHDPEEIKYKDCPKCLGAGAITASVTLTITRQPVKPAKKIKDHGTT